MKFKFQWRWSTAFLICLGVVHAALGLQVWSGEVKACGLQSPHICYGALRRAGDRSPEPEPCARGRKATWSALWPRFNWIKVEILTAVFSKTK